MFSGEIKIPAEFCQKDLDLSSDFKVLLPQRQGAGLCSTALVSYLIALHNDLIYCVDKHTGEETRWGRSCHIFLIYKFGYKFMSNLSCKCIIDVLKQYGEK